jgi:hypothetical protein
MCKAVLRVPHMHMVEARVHRWRPTTPWGRRASKTPRSYTTAWETYASWTHTPEGYTPTGLGCQGCSMADSPFALYQRELDGAFHGRADPVPAGTAEHGEALVMLEKLLKLKEAK